MDLQHIPHTSGIYQIRNKENGKLYIGSAVDLVQRTNRHVWLLTSNRHVNIKLQRAWNKYGPSKFECYIVELVPSKEQLIEREQYWIDITQSYKTGYNMSPSAGSQLGFKFTEECLDRISLKKSRPIEGFISPEGYQVTVLNLRLFCRQQGLISVNGMRALVTGRSTSYKGWTHVNAKKPEREWIKTYEGFVDPEGNKIESITNLEQFCRDNGLDASGMHSVYAGKKPSHKGWSHIHSVNKRHHPKRWAEYPGWVSPDGEEVTIVNMRDFCHRHNLDQPSMWKVMQGVYPQHKGWRYPAGGYTPKQRETVTWRGYISPAGEPVVITNLFAFCKDHGLDEGHMKRLRDGSRKQHKGWTYDPAYDLQTI